MKHSESIKHILPALLAAQHSIGSITKNAENPHLRNKYADISEILDTILPVLNENGLLVLQPPSNGEHAQSVAVETVLFHAETGEFISESITMPVTKNDAQGFGSAITYGRRYTIQSLLSLRAEDDDGNGAAGVTGSKAAAAAKGQDRIKQEQEKAAKAGVTPATPKPANVATAKPAGPPAPNAIAHMVESFQPFKTMLGEKMYRGLLDAYGVGSSNQFRPGTQPAEECWREMRTRAENLGYTYDKATKAWKDPENLPKED